MASLSVCGVHQKASWPGFPLKESFKPQIHVTWMNTEVIYVIVSNFDHFFRGNELYTRVVYSESLLSFLCVDPVVSFLDW